MKKKRKTFGETNRELLSSNTALKKSNVLLEESNRVMTLKSRNDTEAFANDLRTGKAANRKLKQSVQKGNKSNTALKKSNNLLEESNRAISLKSRKDTEAFANDLRTGNALNKKLKQSVQKGNKNNTALQKSNTLLETSNLAMTSKSRKDNAAFNRHIRNGKTLNEKLTLAIETGSKETKAAKAKIQRKDIQLELLNKEILTFSYISSHDMQEPLRNLQMLSSLILLKEEKNLSEQGKDYFRRMQNSAKQLQELIQDLVEYSNTNKAIFKLEYIDLNVLLSEVKLELVKTLKTTQARVLSNDLCTVTVVPFQFKKLFKELICNAVKFARPGLVPKINIKAEFVKGAQLSAFNLSPKKRYCHISFSDNGIGFEAVYRERIFEVFQKLHGKAYPGSGIGLATCRKIVENHGGVITGLSDPGVGSIFDIYIPAK